MSNRLRRASFILVVLGIAATAVWYFAIRLPPIPRRPLRIGFEQNLPVQIRTPSGFAGLAVDTVNEAAQRVGVQLEWIETGTSSDEAFRKGLVDLWPMMANLPERRKRVHITRPWLHSRLVLVVADGAEFPDRRFTGRIALFKIPLHYRILREAFPEAQLVQLPEALEVVKEVCRGTAVGFVDEHIPNALKEKSPECASVSFRVRTDPGMTLEFGVASTFEAARAAEMIRREIGNMFRDGTLASSMARYSYFGVDSAWGTYDMMEVAERARWMTWGVSALLIALSLALWQTLSLRQRKRAEAVLAESEERFRAIFSQAAVGIAQTSLDGKWLLLNNCFCEILGYSQDELREKKFLDVTHPDDREASLAGVRRLRAGEIPFWSTEKRYIRKDGSTVWARLFTSPVLGKDNQPQYFIAVVEDITGKIQAERALRDSEQRLSLAQSAARLGIWDRDLRTNVITIGGEYTKLYGLPAGQPSLTRDEWSRLVHPDDRERVDALMQESLEKTHVWDAEFRVLWPDGSVHWILGKGAVHLDDAGRASRLVGVNLDISELKQTEAALRASEEGLKNAERLAHVGSWNWNATTNRVNWSEEMFRIFGKPQDYTPSFEGFLESIIPQDRERMERRVRDTLAGHSGHSVEYQIARPNGDLRTIAAVAEALHPASIFGACQDVTESRQAEAKLRESEERFRRIADTAPVMIGVSGPDKLASFFNRAWLDFRGRAMEQELGDGWTEGLHPDDRDAALANYYSLFDASGAIKCECRFRRADGEYRWLLCSGVARFEPGRNFAGIIVSAIDITDIKRTQEETTAKQKLESLGTLANGIAHDFNNLLGGVLAQAELALDELAAGSPPEEELKAIREVAIRGSEIVRQLMMYAGKESGALELVDVSRTVEQMLALLKVSVSKRATLQIDLGKDLPAVRANTAQLRQIVLNLVTNGSEAIGDQDGVIRLTTRRLAIVRYWPGGTPEGLAEGDYLQLEVSDTGGGMPLETQARVFDPFFTTKSTGHGLGLAVVHGIVRSLGGAIHLESEPGKGSTFQILLPGAGTAAEAPNGRTSGAEETAGPSPEASVLIVEDEAPLRQAVVKMLRKTGFSVMEACDGSAALEVIRLRRTPIDVLFLDITLPGTPSREVFEEAKCLRPEMRVIITSAYTEDLATASLEGRIERFIQKPYRFSDLMDLVRQSLS